MIDSFLEGKEKIFLVMHIFLLKMPVFCAKCQLFNLVIMDLFIVVSHRRKLR